MNTFEYVLSKLGTPAFQTDNVLIYRGDCIELMQELNKPIFDLTVTSPPYNIGLEYEKEKCSANEYIKWCIKWIDQIYRLTISTGAFWLNVGYTYISNKGKSIPIPWLLWEKIRFFLVQEIIWYYSNGGVNTVNTFAPRHQKLLWYVKKEKSYIFDLDDVRHNYKGVDKNIKNHPFGKNPTDVWCIPKISSNSKERTRHPAPFPLKMIRRIIKGCSNIEDTIFDPFLGSGTTAVAALQTDRLCIGFEKRRDYIAIAKRRIKDYLKDR